MWLNRLRQSAYFAWQLRGQAEFPFQQPEIILHAQTERLRWMVAYAYRSVPYYRETFDRLGLRPADFRSVDDLANLPILERAKIQQDPEYFCSTSVPQKNLLKLRSGGSTGATRTIFHDPRGVFANAAHGERERSIWTSMIGKKYGYRELVISPPNSSTFKVQRFCRQHGLYPRRVSIERDYLSLLDSPETTIQRINAFQPHIIHAYGSYFSILFGHLAATNEDFYRPIALTYTSDDLSVSVRRLINKRFKLPVFTTYQAVEAFKIGFECEEHSGVHLNVDLYPLRIVDASGRTLPAGESGEVIVSNLVNGGTVLLNYRLGDIAALQCGQCHCGRSLPLLSFPQGRSDDLIKLASGHIVHPQGIRNLFNDEELILEYQVVHQTDTHFRVSLLATPTCDHASTRQRIEAKLAGVFGDNITTDIAFVTSIDRTAGGKFRPVISLLQRERFASPSQTNAGR